jgi:hypothetical protein
MVVVMMLLMMIGHHDADPSAVYRRGVLVVGARVDAPETFRRARETALYSCLSRVNVVI